MTSPRYARFATELLAQDRGDVPPPREEERARAIAAIEAAIRAEARARRVRTIGWASGLAAAAAALAVFGAVRLHRRPITLARASSAAHVTATAHSLGGRVVLEHAGKLGSVDEAVDVAPGDHVLASNDGRAAIALSTGTHLVLESGSDLGVVEQSSAQIYALRTGAVRADVAKVPSGGRFEIRTQDAEIEVRGTSFRVSVAPSDPGCGGGTTTRVAVSEGVVVVRHHGLEERVPAGESWPRGCTAVTQMAPFTAVASVVATAIPSSAAAPAPTAATGGGPAKGASVAEVKATPASELAAQNDLFAAATGAKRRGDTAGAIAGYERFLAKYPTSALAESATVERMRLLASSDPGRGAIAAKSYLARYPNGFARAEARAIVDRAP